MAKGNVTTITHPDGTVSKRKSESRIYTHGVVICRSRESLVEDELATAALYDGHAATAERAVGGEITESRSSWSGGLEYISLKLDGQYAESYVSDRERPTDEELRDGMRKRVAENEARAAKCRDRAEELRRGPAADYGVLRWSSRADLAHKAASGEYGSLVRPGVSIAVVPVD
jgi:hypothetical protein